MTEVLSGVEAPSDAELISCVRGGDTAAYGELFNRHVEAARRLGRQLVRGTDVDDLVSEAFAKMLHILQGGGGPDVAFRAYLLTSVRRLHVDRIRAASRVQPTEDMSIYDPGVPFQDTAVAGFENGAAAKAFGSLPERWQLVLWHLEVEGQKPAEIAPLLGMSANSVSALAYRAREGLRQAFLTMHLAEAATAECRWVNEHLGAYVRKGLARRDTAKVEAHLEECRPCTAMYLELSEVNSNLAGIIAPLLLGAAAAGYLSSTGVAGGALGFGALIGRAREFVSSNAAATAGGAVAAGIAAVTTAALVLGGGGGREAAVGADQPSGTVQAPDRGEAPRDTDREPRVRKDQEVLPGGAAPVLDVGVPDTALALPPPAPGVVTEPAAAPDVDDAVEEPPAEDPPAGSQTPPEEVSTVTTRLSFGSATIDGSDLVLELVGDPVLPSSVTFVIASEPAGITFGDGGTDGCATSGTTATCTPVPTTLAAGSAAFPSAAGADSTYRVRLPLVIPASQPETALTLSATLPQGYLDLGGVQVSLRYLPRTGGESPGNGDPGTGDPGSGDPGTGDPGSGDPGTGGPGNGDPGSPGTGGGDPGGPGGGGPGNGDPGTGGPGGGDPDPAPVDFAISGVDSVQVGSGGDQHLHQVTTRFAGVEEGGTIHLSLSNNQDRFDSATGCDVAAGGRSMTCTVPAGSATASLSFAAWLPGRGQGTSTLVATFLGDTVTRSLS